MNLQETQVFDSLRFSKHNCTIQSYLHSFCTCRVYVLSSLPWAAIGNFELVRGDCLRGERSSRRHAALFDMA